LPYETSAGNLPDFDLFYQVAVPTEFIPAVVSREHDLASYRRTADMVRPPPLAVEGRSESMLVVVYNE
jgi:hypothetical protein